ncbi:MAG: peptidoglycan DD-metalloendopeptidase family protein, partial [Clostridia bacterium]|nr:peptidoglycan DD-metalloendopeptidase family protein [Clostridia bacterium]
EEYDESIPYSVNKTNSNSLTAGKTKVVKKGKNGTNHITASVTYIDGVETERVITDTQVVSQPVTQQVLVGTKKAATVKSSKVMVWPIAASARYVITSYFNEERSTHAHGGLDIACDKGTEIYAAMAGTVTVAKNSGSYGKHIMIDHGSNIVTVYAHCSALYVTVGDKVAKGEHIAAVGNTGRSTGNHLHFEVRINGKKYNPLNYVNK